MASGTGSKFLYFAFGSNMCTKRIHINNPSAVFKHVAVVEGYKLFFGYSDSNVSTKRVIDYITYSTLYYFQFEKLL